VVETKIPESDVWEAVQIISGDTFIYRNGYKEEADIKDVIKFDAGFDKTGQIVYQFARFDFNPAKPAPHSTIRMNRSAITFAWYIDPTSEIITRLKVALLQMDATRAGLIIPKSGVL